MAISDELTRIQTAKADIKTAIEAKGVTVPSSALIDEYADYVDAIQTGGGTKDYIIEGTEYDPTATYRGLFDPLGQIVSADIPSGFQSIMTNGFGNAFALTSVTIPNTVTAINLGAFHGCNSLTSVTIPNSVTTMGATTTYSNGVFQDCSSLTSVTFEQGSQLTGIGNHCFRNCSSLTSVNLPTTLTILYKDSFFGCGSLTSITIPSGVTSIANQCFYNCTSLNSVTCLATTPPTLGTQVFDNTNDCPIYVPSESVAAYQAASGWSNYASRIQAIPS